MPAAFVNSRQQNTRYPFITNQQKFLSSNERFFVSFYFKTADTQAKKLLYPTDCSLFEGAVTRRLQMDVKKLLNTRFS
jgi:hypothetical protein